MSLIDENQAALPVFARAAEDFCLLIDSFCSGRPKNLYTTLEMILARLHSGILPVIAQMNEKENIELETLGEMTHEQWFRIAKLIQTVTEGDRSELVERHIEISDGEYDQDACRVDTLWDDLADIYRDLKHGLVQWDARGVEGQIAASWEWRYNYEIHWGIHLASAMQTVHELRYRLYRD